VANRCTTPASCRQGGENCAVTADCCSPFICLSTRCTAPPSCRQSGETCAVSADCCQSLACVANRCGQAGGSGGAGPAPGPSDASGSGGAAGLRDDAGTDGSPDAALAVDAPDDGPPAPGDSDAPAADAASDTTPPEISACLQRNCAPQIFACAATPTCLELVQCLLVCNTDTCRYDCATHATAPAVSAVSALADCRQRYCPDLPGIP
jgi:hypothetical protein